MGFAAPGSYRAGEPADPQSLALLRMDGCVLKAGDLLPSVKVLFVTSEVAGLAKAGGLGEVSAGLPWRCASAGSTFALLMPAYGRSLRNCRQYNWTATCPGAPAFRRPAGRGSAGGRYDPVSRGIAGVVRSPWHTLLHAGRADWQDNHLRFARLSLAAADIAAGRGGLGWKPDIVHVNDWPGGLTPAYMQWDGTTIPTVLTIHNIAYQGNFDAGQRHSAGYPRRGVQHQRRRIPRPGLVPEGRRLLCQPRHHGQPDICLGNHHRNPRRRAARVDGRAGRQTVSCPASSTASTRAGIPAATHICHTISTRTT